MSYVQLKMPATKARMQPQEFSTEDTADPFLNMFLRRPSLAKLLVIAINF